MRREIPFLFRAACLRHQSWDINFVQLWLLWNLLNFNSLFLSLIYSNLIIKREYLWFCKLIFYNRFMDQVVDLVLLFILIFFLFITENKYVWIRMECFICCLLNWLNDLSIFLLTHFYLIDLLFFSQRFILFFI